MPVSQSLSDVDTARDVADALVVPELVLETSVLSLLSTVVSETSMLLLVSLLLACVSLLEGSRLLLLLLVYTSRAQRSVLSLLLILVTAWLPERTELLVLLQLFDVWLPDRASSAADCDLSDSVTHSCLRFKPRLGLMACTRTHKRTLIHADHDDCGCISAFALTASRAERLTPRISLRDNDKMPPTPQYKRITVFHATYVQRNG